MRTTWSALQASLSRQMNRDTAKAAFLEMQKTHPDLARFASISCLMQHQHAVGGEASAKFNVIRSLVSAAQSERDHRSTAQVMVIVALWPGLDAVFWRLWRGFPDARDDLASDIIARLGEAILAMDLEKVTAVTATLLRNLERDLGRDLIGARVIADTSHPIDDPAVEMQASGWNAHGEACERSGADLLAGLDPKDALLLRRVHLLGETQAEAGSALGLSASAARKRYQRALEKLRAQQKIPAALSHSAASVGL